MYILCCKNNYIYNKKEEKKKKKTTTTNNVNKDIHIIFSPSSKRAWWKRRKRSIRTSEMVAVKFLPRAGSMLLARCRKQQIFVFLPLGRRPGLRGIWRKRLHRWNRSAPAGQNNYHANVSDYSRCKVRDNMEKRKSKATSMPFRKALFPVSFL